MTTRLKPGAPLRVLMTADAVGGVWTYALDLAREFSHRRIETTLAVLGPAPDEAQSALAAKITNLRVVPTGLPLEWTATDAGAVLASGETIAALASETASDIVHLNSPALAARARFPAPVLAVAHSCVATWWASVRTGPLSPDFGWMAELVGAGYRNAAAVVAPTACFARATGETYDLPEQPRVVPNGRPPLALGSPHEDLEPVFAFTAGRLWDEGKNLDTLDLVAARLDCPILAAGPLRGPNGAALELSHVRPLGPLPDSRIRGYLAARPIFVSLARYEPFGLAVLEAAQAGCPLVLSDIPTFREIWDDAAWFVPVQNEASAVEAIRKLAEDPALRRRLGAAAAERARGYSARAMADNVLAIYRELLGVESLPGREAAA